MRTRASLQLKQLQELGRAISYSFSFCGGGGGEVCGVGGKLRHHHHLTQIGLGESRWMMLMPKKEHMTQRSRNPNPNLGSRIGFFRALSSLEVERGVGERRWMMMMMPKKEHIPQRSGNPNPNLGTRIGSFRALSSLEAEHGVGESRWMMMMMMPKKEHMPQRSENPNPNLGTRFGFFRALSSLEAEHDVIGKSDLRCFAPPSLAGDHEQQMSGSGGRSSIFAVRGYKLSSEGLRTHASKATAWETEPESTAHWEALQSQHNSNSSQGDHHQKLVMGDGDPVDWSQRNLRLREFDARQRTAAGVPAPKVQPDDVYIPVKAFYVSRSIDLKRLSEEPFLEITSSRNNLIIRFPNRPVGAPPTTNKPGLVELSQWHERYMVAFQYGSIVFFNFGDDEEEEALSAMRKFCTDEFRETRKDDYGVLVRPTLPEWSEGGQDQITLRMLDTDNIRVISSILGQSIALDHYAKRVDEMVNTFSELNRGMEKTGTFTMTRKSLFQLVAAANTTLADVILRLGLLERSDAAWKDANYAQIWEYLRDDFELDERFESLDFKLNIIQHNVRFFLEILQNRKSDTLEWIIILLITGEICVSLYDILHTAGAI